MKYTTTECIITEYVYFYLHIQHLSIHVLEVSFLMFKMKHVNNISIKSLEILYTISFHRQH